MLISMIAPHLFNVVSVAHIVKRTGGSWGEVICFGVVYAHFGILGAHEFLIVTDPVALEIADAMRSNNVLFEDQPQLILQNINSMAVG